MADSGSRFSRRHGFSSRQGEPLIYHDAPEAVRVGLLSIVHDQMDKGPDWMRNVICGTLRVRPNPNNWSSYPNIWDEVQNLVHRAEWFQVYDIVESFAEALVKYRELNNYEAHINGLLDDEGIGWRLSGTTLEIHGDRSLESVIGEAEQELEKSGFEVASSELAEARVDLSRRPNPDLSGAVQHAMAALESVTRQVSGDPKRTLGDIIKRHPGLFPSPVDDAAAKLWGFASEQARHGSETRQLAWEEVLLVVGLAGALCSYLNAKKDL